MTASDKIFLLVLVCGILLSLLLKKLTVDAAIVGGILATLIYTTTGSAGVALMAGFFCIGVVVTFCKKRYKVSEALSSANSDKRNTGQVFANAGSAAIIALVVYQYSNDPAMAALFVASCFSSATADTVSSELGNVYGTKFYNCLSLKNGRKGANGVISVEGSLLGVLGSCIIACIYVLFFGWTTDAVIIVLAGTVGNFTDSVLGAAFEEKGYIGNNMVNFLNTCAATVFTFLVKLP